MSTRKTLKIPTLLELGADLRETSRVQLVLTLGSPFAFIAAYAALACHGHWIPAFLCIVALSFVTYTSTSHDLVHRALGLKASVNDAFLFVIELLCLRSGTSYRVSHLQHHRAFPSEADVEGHRASLSVRHALVDGLSCQFRLWAWAWRSQPSLRGRLVLEATFFVLFWVFALALAGRTPVPLVYGILVLGGSWFFPLATVYMPHDRRGEDELTQTRWFRGLAVRVLFLDHLYHLEHHLYPGVPHHKWPQLGKRLDPFLEKAGLEKVPLTGVFSR